MCFSTFSSATGAVKSSTRRRDSKDTFYSSDEDLSLGHHAHSSEGTRDREGEISSSDEGSSSEEDEREGEKEGGRSKVKGGRGERVNNERGAGGGKSESESESESSSLSEEEEGGVRGGGGGKKLFMGQSRSKEKVNKIIKFGRFFNYYKFSIINYTALLTDRFNSSQEVHECYSDEPFLLPSQDGCCSWLKQSHATEQ